MPFGDALTHAYGPYEYDEEIADLVNEMQQQISEVHVLLAWILNDTTSQADKQRWLRQASEAAATLEDYRERLKHTLEHNYNIDFEYEEDEEQEDDEYEDEESDDESSDELEN